MRTNKSQKHYLVALDLGNGRTKMVNINASTQEVAERRALKHNPKAVRVKKPTA